MDIAHAKVTVLGGGCFWCLEAVFRDVQGVLEVSSGYAGGLTNNPSYEEVCTGRTGNAEVVKITFDPSTISFKDLLDWFWHCHDPTSLNRQGADVGSQYRSIILYSTEEQFSDIQTSIAQAQTKLRDTIVTEVTSLARFWPAENYHQRYFEKHPDESYCKFVIAPKLAKLGF